MSATNTLADILKTTPTASSASGLSTLLVNSLGELVKTGTMLVNATARTNLDLNDFHGHWGIFTIDNFTNTCQNVPVQASGLVIISFGGFQIILRGGLGGRIYFRSYTSGAWQPWKEVTASTAIQS